MMIVLDELRTITETASTYYYIVITCKYSQVVIGKNGYCKESNTHRWMDAYGKFGGKNGGWRYDTCPPIDLFFS